MCINADAFSAQAQQRNPLHMEAMRHAEESSVTMEEALVPLLHRQPPPAGDGDQRPSSAQSPYRRWCAERIAAGELYVLDKARASLDDLGLRLGDSGAGSDDSEEASDVDHQSN